MKTIQLTAFNDPKTAIDSQYGQIPYLSWLEKEKERIERDPTRMAEIKTNKGRVALFVNPC